MNTDTYSGSLPSLPAGWALYVAEATAGQAPAGPRLPLAFAPFLYFTPAHQALQRLGQPVLSFFLENLSTGYTVAQLFVVPNYPVAGQASSPGQATFGGVQLAAGVPSALLHCLLAAVEAALARRQQHAFVVRAYPFCYDPAGAAQLAEVLQQRAYEVELAEENYYLDLERDFEAHLHPSAQRRLRQCRRAGLVLGPEPPTLLPRAYEFIAACRAERQQPALSLSLGRLQELFACFPERYLLLSVRAPGGDWAALTVAIWASERVLHNFYPASPLAFNRLSPAVLLTAGLHELGRTLGAQVLDLGRSTLGGREPHESLLRFKRHLGGLSSPKLTWRKQLV